MRSLGVGKGGVGKSRFFLATRLGAGCVGGGFHQRSRVIGLPGESGCGKGPSARGVFFGRGGGDDVKGQR